MKQFINKNIKTFITVLITTIIVGSISVYAASQYFAKDISFTPTNENFKKENGEPIDNVEDAINQLYSKSGNTIPNTQKFYLMSKGYSKTYRADALFSLYTIDKLYSKFKVNYSQKSLSANWCTTYLWDNVNKISTEVVIGQEYTIGGENQDHYYTIIWNAVFSSRDNDEAQCNSEIELIK